MNSIKISFKIVYMPYNYKLCFIKVIRKKRITSLFKMSSVTTLKSQKSINLQEVLYSNIKCLDMTELINTEVVKSLGEGSTDTLQTAMW